MLGITSKVKPIHSYMERSNLSVGDHFLTGSIVHKASDAIPAVGSYPNLTYFLSLEVASYAYIE